MEVVKHFSQWETFKRSTFKPLNHQTSALPPIPTRGKTVKPLRFKTVPQVKEDVYLTSYQFLTTMRKLLIVLLLAGAVFACTQMKNDSEETPPIFNEFCNNGGNELCPQLPYDADINTGIGYDSDLDSIRQPPFDVFSWQTFVALNWPADSAGNPMGNSIADNPNAPRVWDFYKDPVEVFDQSSKPLMLHLKAAKDAGKKFFFRDSKSPFPLTDMHGFQEADGHPLIDRNINFVLYEIKMNSIESNFITANQLTTVENIYTYAFNQDSTQNKGKKTLAMTMPPSDSLQQNPGTIEIKASWRILVPAWGDDTTRYHCRQAIIYVDSSNSLSGKSFTVQATVGLVGMHIVRKTGKFYQNLIWSTFEHVDNAPDNLQQAQMERKRRWSFYNQQCLNCPQNNAPQFKKGDSPYYKWRDTMPYAHRYATHPTTYGQRITDSIIGTQVIRQWPVYYFTELINQLWQAKLKGTVWANYRLIGSQWLTGELENQAPSPFLLGNTTLETYIQADASCIGCHSDAYVRYPLPGTKDTVKITTDLSFLFPVYAR